MLKYIVCFIKLGKMGRFNILHNTTLIAILAIAAVGIGTVVATQTIQEDLVVQAGGGDPGNIIIQDGGLGIGDTPSATQLIRAKAADGSAANFLVRSDNADAVFNLRSLNGQPALQLQDGDSGQKYRLRLESPSGDLVIVDNTSGQNIRFKIQPNGDVCIGAC